MRNLRPRKLTRRPLNSEVGHRRVLLAQAIRYERMRIGVTQTILAERLHHLGINQNDVVRFETASKPVPAEILTDLASELGVTVAHLLNERPPPDKSQPYTETSSNGVTA